MPRSRRFLVPVAGAFGLCVLMPRHGSPPKSSKIRQSPVQAQEPVARPLMENKETQELPRIPTDPFLESFEQKFLTASETSEESIQPGIESQIKEALREDSQMDSMHCFDFICRISLFHAAISEADAFANRALADRDESNWLQRAYVRTLEVNSDGSLVQVVFLELAPGQR